MIDKKEVQEMVDAWDDVINEHYLKMLELWEKEGSLYAVSESNDVTHIPLRPLKFIYGNPDHPPVDWVPPVPDCVQHEWVDTGMRKSWCKLCNTDKPED